MASHLCTSLDSCSVKNYFPSITCHHVPSKPFLILPTIHFSHDPIPTRIRRRRRRSKASLQFHVIPPDFDIVETFEHHDGSVIFRFGDPREIVKSDESVKDLESEVEEGSVAVKVLDGEHERDVTVNGSASTLSTEGESDVDKDVSDSLLESSERFLEISQEGELSLPVPVSVVAGETHVVADTSDFEEESSGRLLEISQEGKLSVSVDEEESEVESEVERELSDSEEALSENLPEISQDGELPFPVPVSVLEEESNVAVDISDSEVESSEIFLEVSLEGKVSISTVEGESEVETELSDSREESREKLPEISQYREAPLLVPISVLEGQGNVAVDISDSEVESSEIFLEVSQEVKVSISTVEGQSEVETELSDSREESSERLPEISQEVEVPLPVLISVSEIELSDPADTGLCFENDIDDEECLNEKDEDASSSPDIVTVSDDNLRMKISDDSHEVIAEVTMYESPSFKLDMTIEDARIEVMQLSDQKTEAGLQTEVADSINVAGISVVGEENDKVGDLRDPRAELNERSLKISQEVDVDVSVSETKMIDHFDMVSILEEVVEDKDSSNEKDDDGSSMPEAVTDNSLSVGNRRDTEQVTGDETEVQLPSADLDDLVLQEPIIEAMLSVDTEQKGVAEPQLVDTKDSSENHTEVMHISYPLEAEMMLEGVSHDDLEESVEADEIESSTMLNHDVVNSLLETKRTEGEDQSSELSEVSSVEPIQFELTETFVEREEISTAAFFLSSGAAALAHPSKALTGGEDAYFLSGSNWLGVANGVGQWSLEGIAPGVYAHELMKNCQSIVSDGGNAPMVNPIELLSRCVEETQFSGSSTVLVAYVDGLAFHVANIGDTGFIIVRHGAVYKKSSPMLHEFNFPIHVESGDNPSQLAEEYRIDIDAGDTIITATDGLFDNMYEQEILAIVSKSLQTDMKPEEIAEVLAKRAVEAGGSATSRSPFADAAQAAGYIGYTGGKLDGVAVIVSFVENRS